MSNPEVPPPWPLVPECQERHRELVIDCPQHDGRHTHDWIGWDGQILTAGQWGKVGVSIRCGICGGRKCDMQDCSERRHHTGPHADRAGQVIGQVGA